MTRVSLRRGIISPGIHAFDGIALATNYVKWLDVIILCLQGRVHESTSGIGATVGVLLTERVG